MGHPNPLATALMARMRIARPERWQVKAAALRQLMGLRISAEQRRMLGTFISIYLPLNAHETARFEADVATWQPDTKEQVVEFISEWEQKGIEKGIEQGIEKGIQKGIEKGISIGLDQGQQALLIRQLTHRYGPLPTAMPTAITRLSSHDLLALGEALFDFTSLAEVEAWLAQH